MALDPLEVGPYDDGEVEVLVGRGDPAAVTEPAPASRLFLRHDDGAVGGAILRCRASVVHGGGGAALVDQLAAHPAGAEIALNQLRSESGGHQAHGRAFAGRGETAGGGGQEKTAGGPPAV